MSAAALSPTGIPISVTGQPSIDDRFHLIGIGGAGMSGMAFALMEQGAQISGSDRTESPTIQALRQTGAQIGIGDWSGLVAQAAWIVASDAIWPDHPEIQWAIERDVPVWRRSQMLAWLLRNKRLIAVAGTHGKTTATAMIAAILEQAGLDPVVALGGEPLSKGPQWRGGWRIGQGEWAVAEACEAYGAFLDLTPEIALVTNIEADHLDHHKSFDALKEKFRAFIQSASQTAIVCADDETALRVAQESGRAYETYGFDQGALESIRLAVPGRHNALNALGAISAALKCGATLDDCKKALETFSGTRRRLEHVAELQGIAVIDDYAHHPTEIRASIEAVRTHYPNRRLIVVFQPHLYSRTRDFLQEFADALALADWAVLTDIYPARETPIPGISAAVIVERLHDLGKSNARYVPVLSKVAPVIAPKLRAGDILVLMGAGDIDKIPAQIVRRLEHRDSRPRIAVLMGGDSEEREVSLISGRRVMDALRDQGFETVAIDPAKPGELAQLATDGGFDAAFVALHGRYGEGGSVQGLLDMLGIPYTGSDPLASALAMNKAASLAILRQAGLTTPQGRLARRGDALQIGPPCAVKPNSGGSTLGVSIVRNPDRLDAALERAWALDEAALVEELIEGVEISATILGLDDPICLPLVEILPRQGFYDFQAKYEQGATEEIVPARISMQATERASEAALVAHKAIGCRGLSRVDMIIRDDEPVILEINTVPGLTPTSLAPRCAEAAGISFGELCRLQIEYALQSWSRI